MYREAAPAPKPAPEFITSGGVRRPANRVDLYAHRVFCPVLNGRPIALPETSHGADRGFERLCFCGLLWAGDL
jgi:hypothetical protein